VSTPAAGAAVRVSVHHACADLPAVATALLRAMRERNPFVCDIWFEAFERHLLRAGERPCYLCVGEGGTVQAVLPLLESRHPLAGTWRLRGMANFYTGVFEAPASPALAADDDLAERLATAVAAHLRRAYPRLALLELQPLRAARGLCAALPAALRMQGFASRRYVAHGNWYEPRAGRDFAAYLADRPGAVRSTLARKQRALAREPGYTVQISDDPAAIAGEMPTYRAIYAASWKTAELSDVFIEDVMVRLGGAGIVNLGVLRVAGHGAAAQLWLKMDRTWAVFKLAYDPGYQRHSVGTVLMGALLERFLATPDCDGLDFLSGDDLYKGDWATQRREHWGFEAIAGHSLAGRLLRLRRHGAGVALERAVDKPAALAAE